MEHLEADGQRPVESTVWADMANGLPEPTEQTISDEELDAIIDEVAKEWAEEIDRDLAHMTFEDEIDDQDADADEF